MSEQFSFLKLIKSPLSGIYWVKCVMFGGGVLALVVAGYGIYKAYFKKPEPTQMIRAEKGSNLTVVQHNERKKTLIPFVEGYIDQPSDHDFETGIRAGVRFEW